MPTNDPNSNGAEPVYGPAYAASAERTPQASHDPRAGAGPIASPLDDAPEPPYTAPYPPGPADTPATYGISPRLAAGLAYFTIIPAVVFLLLDPYRSSRFVRFHSWQSIFLFLAFAAARTLLRLVDAALPAVAGLILSSLLILGFLGIWLAATLPAFSGRDNRLPWIGRLAASTAA